MRRAGKILVNSHIEVIVDHEKYWQGDDALERETERETLPSFMISA